MKQFKVIEGIFVWTYTRPQLEIFGYIQSRQHATRARGQFRDVTRAKCLLNVKYAQDKQLLRPAFKCDWSAGNTNENKISELSMFYCEIESFCFKLLMIRWTENLTIWDLTGTYASIRYTYFHIHVGPNVWSLWVPSNLYHLQSPILLI